MKRSLRYLGCLCSGFLMGVTSASADDSGMTSLARIAQGMQSKLHPQILLPVTYNFNRRLGSNNNINQDEFEFEPLIPININANTSFILNPMLTGNLNTQYEKTDNQAQPFQLASYLAFTDNHLHYGIGPYYQSPALSANGGPQQSGLGVSYGFYYRPAHWVIGGTAYNSWGIGNNISEGTANIFSATPIVSYTTNNAWTYNLTSTIKYNWNVSRATNQLTLSGGKTVSMFGVPVEIQFGPTYMLTSTPLSAKGGGVFFKIAGSLDARPN